MIGMWFLFLAGLILLIAARGVFVAIETASRATGSEEQMERWEKSDDAHALEVHLFLKDSRRPFLVALWEVALLVSAVILFVSMLSQLLSVSEAWRMVWINALAIFVLLPLLVILTELVPQRLAKQHADAILLRVSKVMNRLSLVFIPLILGLTWIAEALLRPIGIERAVARKTFRREDLQEIVEEEEESGETESVHRTMISGIFNLHDTRVREVMRPLSELVAIRLPATQRMVCTLASLTGYSRFPVYRKHVIDLIGYVNVLEILYADNLDEPLEKFIRPTYYVPETKRIDDLLQEFLDRRLKVAVAIDEHGSCSGWITREDILEEIVGDIDDEFDRSQPQLEDLGDGHYRVPAAYDLDDLSDVLNVDLAHPIVDTLGGFIYDDLGRVPEEGDMVRFKNLELRVARMDRYRIQTVEIRILPENGEAE